MAADWTAIENAVHFWVQKGCGLAGSRVLFGHSDGPKPSRSFLTVTLGGTTPVGRDDAQELVVPGTPTAGQEVEIRAGGEREFPVTIYAATDAALGSASAKALLSQVQSALGLDSVLDTFWTNGISCFDSGKVLDITTVLDAAHEGRALLETRFYCRDTVSEYTGYIQHVQLVVNNGTPRVVP